MMLLTYEKQHSFDTGFPTFYTRYAEHVNILSSLYNICTTIWTKAKFHTHSTFNTTFILKKLVVTGHLFRRRTLRCELLNLQSIHMKLTQSLSATKNMCFAKNLAMQCV